MATFLATLHTMITEHLDDPSADPDDNTFIGWEDPYGHVRIEVYIDKSSHAKPILRQRMEDHKVT